MSTLRADPAWVTNAEAEIAKLDKTPCDCGACTAQRFADCVELERGKLDLYPRPNAPTTYRLQ